MTELPARWQIFDEVTSTNDTIHRAALAGAPEGTVHIARAQTRGRGRGGHSWWSPAGAGLWMTLLLRPAVGARVAAGISLVAGRAVRDALEPRVEAPITLYWPNDLMVGRRKLGGILGELRNQGENYWIALGIGINIDLTVSQAPQESESHATPGDEIPRELRDAVIGLAEIGCEERDPVALALAITACFWPLYRNYQLGEPLATLVGGEIAHRGRTVTVRLSPGEEFRGVVKGLGTGGELLVRDEAGETRTVSAGEVVYETEEGA